MKQYKDFVATELFDVDDDAERFAQITSDDIRKAKIAYRKAVVKNILFFVTFYFLFSFLYYFIVGLFKYVVSCVGDFFYARSEYKKFIKQEKEKLDGKRYKV